MSLEDLMPPDFEYKFVEKDVITLSDFKCLIRANINSKERFDLWFTEFQARTNTTWNVRKTKVNDGERRGFLFSRDYFCHHSSHRKRTVDGKNKNCNASFTIRIKKDTKFIRYHDSYVKKGLLAILKIEFKHSHRTDVAEAWNWLRRLDGTKSDFNTYFNKGMSPSAAKSYHESIVVLDGPEQLANSQRNPPIKWIYQIYEKWRKENCGGLNIGSDFQQKALLADAATSTSWIPDEKKEGTDNSSKQKIYDPNELPTGQCSNSTSANLTSNSDILIKQEIIETESESNMFDDASFHSSIADGHSVVQFDGQRPSTSYQTLSESSSSNIDYIIPDGPGTVASPAPTQSLMPITMKVEPGDSSQIGSPFSLNSSSHESSWTNKPSQPEVPSLMSKTAKVQPDVTSNSSGVVSEKSCRHESVPPVVSSQIAGSFVSPSSCHGSSWTYVPTQPLDPAHTNIPFRSKDRFDIFGEFIASKLRNLDSKSSAFIQASFADLLFKAEAGMFSDEKSVSDAQTVTSPNENTQDPSEKENVQPKSSSHTESTHQDFRVTQTSLRDDIQHRSPSCRTNQSPPPAESSTSSEPIQLASNTENTLPSTENVTVSQNSSRNCPYRTTSSGPPPRFTDPFQMRPRDDFDVYGEFVASKLRNLDQRSCAFVQSAFADLILKGELGRFVSEREQSFFAIKTNNLGWNCPSNYPQKNV